MSLANLNSELSQTIDAYESCKLVKNCIFDYDKRMIDSESNSNKKNSNLIIVPFAGGEKKRINNLDHFGGKLPFERDNNRNDPLDYFSENNIELNPLKNIYSERVIKKEEKEKDYIRVVRKPTSYKSNKVVNNNVRIIPRNDFDKFNITNSDNISDNILDNTVDLDLNLKDFLEGKNGNCNFEENVPVPHDQSVEKVMSKSKNYLMTNF
jgi:hypothetical protein